MPTGRRAENKRSTIARVTAAAAGLFAERGYAATSVEEIAARAGVSPGTVYNHFGSKGAILFAVTMVRSSEDLDTAAAVVDPDRDGPLDGVMAIVTAYINPILELDRALAAEVFGASFNPSRQLMTADFMARDMRALEHLVTLFGTYRARGSVGAATDPGQAALLVFSVVAMAIITYVTSDSMTPEMVRPLIRTHVELAFRGIG